MGIRAQKATNRSFGFHFIQTGLGVLRRIGTPTNVRVHQLDRSGNVLFATGATVPTDADAGYAQGCRFIYTSGQRATVTYVNLGSATSALFKAVDVVLYDEVAISITEMKALAASQKSLIAAPGSGYVISLAAAPVFIMDYAAVFGGVDGTNGLQVKYTNDAGAAITQVLPTTGVVDQTSDQMRTMTFVTTASVTPVANAAIVLDNTHSGELSGTGSPCRMKLAYIIHATGL